MEKKIIDTKYLNEKIDIAEFEKYGTICIESSTGTGKTTIICDYLRKHKFISLVLLESLANQQYENLTNNKVVCKHYKNDKELRFGDNLIITLQSLSKLTTRGFDKQKLIKEIEDKTLFIDEISLFASGIVNNDTIPDLRYTYSLLKILVNFCKTLIVCQNEISNHAKILIQSRKGETLFIENNYVNFKDCTAEKMNNENDFIELMEKNINNEQYFCCASDSLTKINHYYTILSKDKDKKNFMLLTSETKTKIKSIDDLKNKFIFYSPSISYGIDITLPEKMNMYQYFGGKSINDSMIFQQSMRVRNLKKLYFFCDAKTRERKYNSIDDVKNNFEIMMDTNFMNVCSYIGENDEIQINNESSYYKLFVESVYYNDKIFSNIEYYYVERLKKSGFTIKQRGETEKMSKQLKNEVKAEIQMNKDEIFENFIEETDELKRVLYETYFNRAELLKLENKNNMEKYKDEITDEYKLKNHLNFCKILQKKQVTQEQFNEKTNNKYKVEMCNDALHKVLFVKSIEEKYNIDILNIEYKDEEIKFDENDFDKIKRIFRITTAAPKTYIELMSLYVKLICNVAGADIFNIKKSNKRDHTRNKTLYTIDKEKLTYHLELYRMRNSTFEKLDDNIRTFLNAIVWDELEDIFDM